MNSQKTGELRKRIADRIGTAVVGKADTIDMVIAAVVSGSHVLFEDYPGLGKTLIARSIAQTLGLSFKRIQFTPDLLPQDIVGAHVYDRATSTFKLEKGPIFANVVLADEINRASPRTQSALLEAMQERQVTIEGETIPLPDPFIVLATQNPIEFEGTFPLPEAELDRFGVKLGVKYPTIDEEIGILERRISRGTDEATLESVTNLEEVRAARDFVEGIGVHRDILSYITSMVARTREDSRVAVGASPRASLALVKLARARAALEGRDFVIPDDVKRFVAPVLAHRIVMTPDYWLKPGAAEAVVAGIRDTEPVPAVQAASAIAAAEEK
jgi:MoxR-like ATPase